MAKVQIDITAADKASKTIHNVAGSFTELKSGIDLAMGAAGQIIDMTKQVYDLGKAGAELQYAEVRFERLAERINTTGDALLGKLHDATEGTLSDAQLMAGAGDLMSLGLAKSEDQVIRLSRVIAGLGMDMNQLVLTMSNQTTMRFDQLGVAVDGFDEKVENLKKTGMSANDAFNEAFLQQAEEQLEKVGNKADETIGDFQRFEAALANISDVAKKEAAPAIGSVVGAMADLLEQGAKNSAYSQITKGMSDIERGAYLASMAASDWNDAQREAMHASEDLTEAVEESIEPIDTSAMAAWEAEQAAKAAADAYDEYWRNVNASAEASRNLQSAQEDLALAQANFNAGMGQDIGSDLEEAYRNRTITAEEYEAALGAVDAVSGTNMLTEKKMADAQAALVKQFADGKISVDEFKEGVANLQDVWGPFNEDIEAAGRKVDYLQQQLDRLDGTYYINIEFQQGSWDGTIPGPGSSGGGYTDPGTGSGYNGANGLDFVVPPGYPGDSFHAPLNVTSGERVTVTPNGSSPSGGNTYNLTIRTEQSPRVVQRGFAIERALAGV